MFDIGSTELLLVAIVAIIVIGPKDLPRALYKLGQIVAKARGMARHFRTGLDTMVREAELEEMEKKWAAENKRIMQQWPTDEGATDTTGSLAEPSTDVTRIPAKSDEASVAGDLPSADPYDVSAPSSPAAKDGSAV
jgi:sec-independent protein translocase protein TatB